MLKSFSRLKVVVVLNEADTSGALGDLSMEAIMRKANISRPMLNIILREMRDAGLIVLTRRETDKREKRLELTPEFYKKQNRLLLALGLGVLRPLDEKSGSHKLDGDISRYTTLQQTNTNSNSKSR